MLCGLFFSEPVAHAATVTWTPGATGTWGDPNNWTPAMVPGADDVATFNTSGFTNLFMLSGNFGGTNPLGGITCNPGASAYTFTVGTPQFLQIVGPGMTNNSGIVQTVIVPAPPSPGEGSENDLIFLNSATAGSLMNYSVGSSFNGDTYGAALVFHDTSSAGSVTVTNLAATGKNGDGGVTVFLDSSTAGGATFINNGSTKADEGPGAVAFEDNSTAGNATVTNNGGAAGSEGGSAVFEDNASAANAVITNNAGGQGADAAGGTLFSGTATAGNATLVANGGPGAGGKIQFSSGESSGGSARIEIFGNGQLDISLRDAPGLTTGSLEGDGLVFLGSKNLTLGSNNLSTEFSGILQDGGVGGGMSGSLTKIGKSSLTLSSANTYTGTTTVRGGRLLINNISGSGTGTGTVQVSRGLLGGSGTIAGAVTVGTGAGGATISPGALGDANAGAIVLQSALSFGADGTYSYQLDSFQIQHDEITANGVVIAIGARFVARDLGGAVFALGTKFTVIDNTSANPIGGTFVNIPDHSFIIIRGMDSANKFRVNYEGGDGNDLTLTASL